MEGLRDDALVLVDFDVGCQGQGFEAAGFGREVGDCERLEGDLESVVSWSWWAVKDWKG